MREWHPLSKVVVVLGVLGIGYTLVTEDEPPSLVAVAASPDRLLPAAPGRLADIPDLPVTGSIEQDLPPLEAFAAIIERPLFSPSRRPWEPVVVAVEPQTGPVDEPEVVKPLDPGVAFVGSLKRSGEIMALVTRDNGQIVEALRRGDRIDGWRVVEVTEWSLDLEAGGERHRLEIFN